MQGQTNKTILQNNRQRSLRRNLTDAERKLWRMLRGRQMGGLKFRRQHPFENYILDFACLEKKIVVEVDGGQHQESMEVDGIITKALVDASFFLLQFWADENPHGPKIAERENRQEVTGKKDP